MVLPPPGPAQPGRPLPPPTGEIPHSRPVDEHVLQLERPGRWLYIAAIVPAVVALLMVLVSILAPLQVVVCRNDPDTCLIRPWALWALLLVSLIAVFWPFVAAMLGRWSGRPRVAIAAAIAMWIPHIAWVILLLV